MKRYCYTICLFFVFAICFSIYGSAAKSFCKSFKGGSMLYAPKTSGNSSFIMVESFISDGRIYNIVQDTMSDPQPVSGDNSAVDGPNAEPVKMIVFNIWYIFWVFIGIGLIAALWFIIHRYRKQNHKR